MRFTDLKQALRLLLAEAGITQAQLAQRIQLTPANLSAKINKDDHKIVADCGRIAQALGCSLRLQFIRDDGTIAAEVDYVQGAQRTTDDNQQGRCG